MRSTRCINGDKPKLSFTRGRHRYHHLAVTLPGHILIVSSCALHRKFNVPQQRSEEEMDAKSGAIDNTRRLYDDVREAVEPLLHDFLTHPIDGKLFWPIFLIRSLSNSLCKANSYT